MLGIKLLWVIVGGVWHLQPTVEQTSFRGDYCTKSPEWGETSASGTQQTKHLTLKV